MKRRTLLWLTVLAFIFTSGAVAAAIRPIGQDLDVILADHEARIAALEAVVLTTITTVANTTSTVPPTTTTVAPTTTTSLSTTTTTVAAGALNVRDYGAQGDGVTDDRAAIDTAIKAAISQNRPLYFPAGRYKVEFTATNYSFNYSNSALSIVGAGEEKTVIDVYPKVIDNTNWLTSWTQLKFAVFLNWGNGDLTLNDIAFAGPTGYTAAYPNQQGATYLVYSQGANTGTHNVTAEHVKATEGKFWNGIFASRGHGSVIVRSSTITTWNCVVNNYESTGTVMDRATIIEDSVISSGMLKSLTSDGQNHGIIVYNHPHVALRISRSTLWGNPRGAAKQYGESSAVAYKVPLYSIYDDVQFVNNADFTLITPGAPDIVTYVTGSAFDGGRIGVRSDTVIDGATFSGNARLANTVYAQPNSTIDLTIRNSTFALPRAQAIDTAGSLAGIRLTLENVTFGP